MNSPNEEQIQDETWAAWGRQLHESSNRILGEFLDDSQLEDIKAAPTDPSEASQQRRRSADESSVRIVTKNHRIVSHAPEERPRGAKSKGLRKETMIPRVARMEMENKLIRERIMKALNRISTSLNLGDMDKSLQEAVAAIPEIAETNAGSVGQGGR